MQGLQLNDFGRFVFTDKFGYLKDIEGAYIDDMDQLNVWIRDLEDVVYIARKKDVSLFEPQERIN